MKKILLFSIITGLCPVLHAQVTLSGTSYSENFDGIGAGLPTGWTIADSARADFMGHPASGSFLSDPTYGTFGNGTWYSTRGGFKNYPSADAVGMGSDSVTQVSATDRALGVRQVAGTTLFNSDPGAAFILQLTNTTGFKTFNASFKLQSLDTSSPRVTTWIVDYALGASPTVFTPASVTGTMTTGGHSFTNNTISIDFGTALNNQSQPVWIRIVAVDPSTGSGNRTSTTIDDFSMSWLPVSTTGVGVVNGNSNSLLVLGAATAHNVNMQFEAASAGKYSLVITDLNGRAVYNKVYSLNEGTAPVSLSGLDLAPGMYVAKMSGSNGTSTAKFMVK